MRPLAGNANTLYTEYLQRVAYDLRRRTQHLGVTEIGSA